MELYWESALTLQVPASPGPTRAALDTRMAYDICARITRAASTNFYYGFQALPRDKRNAIYAAYAFCRLCDDIVDEPSRKATAAQELARLRLELAAAQRGQVDGPVWTALADSQRKYGIRQEHLVDVVDGCEMDLTKASYANFTELEGYCRRVASAAGLVVLEVCGYTNEKAVQHAIDLGIAMQITNIMRDLAEDTRNGRVYLPQDEMQRFGYSEADLMRNIVDDRFRGLMKFQTDRAKMYFESGEKLFPYLDRRSRTCAETMARVYRMLLSKIESYGYDVFSRRVSLSKREKLALATRLWLQSRLLAFA